MHYEKKYPSIVNNIIQKENQYKKYGLGHPFRFLKKARGKYLALCDGDDFWMDSNKLQQQFQLMEGSRDASMCFTRYESDQDTSVLFSDITGDQTTINLNNWSSPYIMQTSTSLIRISCLNEEIDKICKCKYAKDIFIFVVLLNKRSAIFLNKITSFYRIQPNSVYAGKSEYHRCISNLNTSREVNKNLKKSAPSVF